ncbi:MAG: ThuA domain-containing protein [Phycisphaerales bacterium]|nr:ThuA domain-containing protein [Phycisphaerales bacterium]
MIRSLAFILIVTSLIGCTRQPDVANHQPHLVLIAAEDEYKSERSLAQLAEDARAKGWTTTLLTSQPDQSSAENLPGLESLEKADAAVLYMRFRRLPADQVAHIDRYLRSGKPVIGIRTSTHAFAYPEGHPLIAWNNMGRDVLGAPWIRHFGHDSTTDVSIAPGAESSPLLAGVEPAFHVRSWLYDLEGRFPPPGSTILLVGQSCDGAGKRVADRPPSPIAWTRLNEWGGRVFTTTLGHPEDFANPSVQRLLLNALEWTRPGDVR